MGLARFEYAPVPHLARAVAVPLRILRSGTAFPKQDGSFPVMVWGGRRGLSVALALSGPAAMPRELLVGRTIGPRVIRRRGLLHRRAGPDDAVAGAAAGAQPEEAVSSEHKTTAHC